MGAPNAKEHLERLIADQYGLWEGKRRIGREEREYLVNLKVHREREEAEYRQARESDQLDAHRKFEQELRIIRQKAAARQEERENDFLRREQILLEKEQESARLIQELEAFMSRLALRANSQEIIRYL
jgi:hypothetical protein